MLLAYVDESYSDEYYWIAAVLCPEGTAGPLANELHEVVRRASQTYAGVSSLAELHGHCLFHGKEDWASVQTMPRVRIGIYNEAFDAIGSSGVEVFIRGVHRPGLLRRYISPDHPHAVVLGHLLERLNDRADQLGQDVLVIADQVDQADEYRQNLWEFHRYGTPGYRSSKLPRVLDTIHFAPSRASRLVQAADLVAYLHRRIRARVDTDERAKRANAAIWSRVSDSVVHSRCWHP